MRKFKATPQKKLIGMAILFVFVPLFLLWYWVFFLGHKPGTDTMVIIACVAALAAFLYLRYKKQAALAKTQFGPAEGEELPEEEPEDDEAEPEEEEGGEEAEFEEGGEEEAEEEKNEEGAEEDEIEEDESEKEAEEEVEEEGSESEALSEKMPKEKKNKKPKKRN